MADFFQDITPPGKEPRVFSPHEERSVRRTAAKADVEDDSDDASSIPIHISEQPRGIRNIPPPQHRATQGSPVRRYPGLPLRPPRRSSRVWLWLVIIAAISVLSVLALLALRPTLVTVTPKSHTVVFTDAMQFTAYPAAEVASGTLAYTVESFDLAASETVASSGSTTTPPSRASGEVTVYNDYSTSAVKLVKNTRFSTPDGLIFRTPEDIVVPGKTSSAPGEVRVTVIADATGNEYNVGPIARFTVPGLQSNAAMYANVYARSDAAMGGGSPGGTGPVADPSTREATVSALQQQLLSQALSKAQTAGGIASMVLPSLAETTYQSAPDTTESGGVGIHEKAHVEIPVFQSAPFAQAVAQYVSADAQDQTVALVPGSNFSASFVSSSTPQLGSEPLNFTLTGQAILVWQVDVEALQQALAGKDSSAFQTVVGSFPGIQEAQARIEPVWKQTFPTNASAIHVRVVQPGNS